MTINYFQLLSGGVSLNTHSKHLKAIIHVHLSIMGIDTKPADLPSDFTVIIKNGTSRNQEARIVLNVVEVLFGASSFAAMCRDNPNATKREMFDLELFPYLQTWSNLRFGIPIEPKLERYAQLIENAENGDEMAMNELRSRIGAYVALRLPDMATNTLVIDPQELDDPDESLFEGFNPGYV